MPAYIIKDSWFTYAVGKARHYAGKAARGRKGFMGGGRSSMGVSVAFSDVRIFESVLDPYLNDPNGKVGKWLHAQGEKVIIGAKSKVGVRTGALRNSIKMQSHEREGIRGQRMVIGSTMHYAYVHHEGSKPVVITPKGTHKVLRFRMGARIIYGKRVIHPGTKPNRYLKSSLKLIDGVK
jgi:hypothetical protein